MLTAPVADPPCPYFYTAPEAPVPVWIRNIAAVKAGVPKTERAAHVYNWTVPLRWGGLKTPDNVSVMAPADVRQKLKAEEFLAQCMCMGQTTVDGAGKIIVHWRSHLSGEPPFNPYGRCPVIP